MTQRTPLKTASAPPQRVLRSSSKLNNNNNSSINNNNMTTDNNPKTNTTTMTTRSSSRTPEKRSLLDSTKRGSVTKKQSTPIATTPVSKKTISSLTSEAVTPSNKGKENIPPHLSAFTTPVSERRSNLVSIYGEESFRTPSSFSEGAAPLTVYRSAKNYFKPSCTPTRLVGRNKERSTVLDFLKETAVAGEPGSLYISGTPGTGKTALVTEILTNIRTQFPSLEKSGIKIFSINCMEVKEGNHIYERILEGFGSNALFENDPYRSLREAVCGNYLKAPRVLVLDEIDHLISKDQGTLYSLFELTAMEDSKLVIIGIANALDLLDRYLPHLEQKDCAPRMLNFLPYNVSEITDIIKGRLMDVGELMERSSPMLLDEDESPLPKKSVLPLMHPSAIELCARKISSSGDLRRALDVSVMMRTPSSKNVPKNSSPLSLNVRSIHDIPKVSVSHILKATASVAGTGPVQRIAGLSTQQKAVLLSLILMTIRDAHAVMVMGNLHTAYMRICNERKLITPVSPSEFRDVISLLETCGLIVLHKSKEERDRRVELLVLAEQVEQGLKGDPLLFEIFERAKAGIEWLLILF
ncbi:P-loop containing nucleoside triphosphate hydrolase protein [Chytridium lagenaria]|nr:P-loop containing nucleoside triphosphate hydrolase protein [Chytridium lagenaria]